MTVKFVESLEVSSATNATVDALRRREKRLEREVFDSRGKTRELRRVELRQVRAAIAKAEGR